MPRRKKVKPCAYCGGEKRIPETKIQPRHVYEEDPYCSRPCCEADLLREEESDDPESREPDVLSV